MTYCEEKIREFENVSIKISLKYPNPFKTMTGKLNADEFQEKADQYCNHLISLFRELNENCKQITCKAESFQDIDILKQAVENIMYDEIHKFIMDGTPKKHQFPQEYKCITTSLNNKQKAMLKGFTDL
jgi:hypothetical protein